MCALSLDPLKKCCINPSKEPAGGNRMCVHTFFAFHPWHCGHSGINKFEIKSIFFKEKFHLMLNAKPLLIYIMKQILGVLLKWIMNFCTFFLT